MATGGSPTAFLAPGDPISLHFRPRCGLYLATYRAYDPVTGRWLSRDPIGKAGGINLYAYVHNDPINLRDPTGLQDDPAEQEMQLQNQAATDSAATGMALAKLADIAQLDAMSKAGAQLDPADTNGVLTRAGRALAKHGGGRPGSGAFCKPGGDSSAMRQRGRAATQPIEIGRSPTTSRFLSFGAPRQHHQIPWPRMALLAACRRRHSGLGALYGNQRHPESSKSRRLRVPATNAPITPRSAPELIAGPAPRWLGMAESISSVCPSDK
jgi:RHS repeat-associated protein